MHQKNKKVGRPSKYGHIYKSIEEKGFYIFSENELQNVNMRNIFSLCRNRETFKGKSLYCGNYYIGIDQGCCLFLFNGFSKKEYCFHSKHKNRSLCLALSKEFDYNKVIENGKEILL